MKSNWKVGLGRQLALAALAVCFMAIPGKAQDARKSESQAPVCTSYPEWSCESQATSGQERAPARKQHKTKAASLHAGSTAQVKQQPKRKQWEAEDPYNPDSD